MICGILAFKNELEKKKKKLFREGNLRPFRSLRLFQRVLNQQPKPSQKELKDSENSEREGTLAGSQKCKGQQQVKVTPLCLPLIYRRAA